MLKIGAAIVVVAALAALVGPWLTPFDPAAQDLALRLAGPTLAHPFGLDELGRDILARVLAGARISFLVGLTVVARLGVGRHAARRDRRLLRRRRRRCDQPGHRRAAGVSRAAAGDCARRGARAEPRATCCSR